MKTLANSDLRQEGWKVLSEHMDIPNAVKFLLMIEKNYGDYSQLKEKLFNKKQ